MFKAFFDCCRALFICSVLSLTYVASLYVWRSKDGRNHPNTIRKRFLSVFVMALMSPCFVVYGTDNDYFRNVSIAKLMGFKWDGLGVASTLPLILTAILFSGPILIHYLDGVYRMYLNRYYWTTNIRNLLWLRNHVVAPFSEEFTFRACMLPILVPCLGVTASIYICPLFFGIAHLHHLIERIGTNSDNLRNAVFISCFQFAYTTLFGMYSTYLFLRTGHFVSSFVVHAFCNHMGFPDFGEIFQYKNPTIRGIVATAYIAGLLVWCYFLAPFTLPHLYNNDIYWEK